MKIPLFQEVVRREQEIAEKNQGLVETRRKHQLVEDTVTTQIKNLQMKLEELKNEHKCNETSQENVISSLTDKLAEVRYLVNLFTNSQVQQSLAQRTEAFNIEGENFPTAPEEGEGGGIYPSLHEQSTMPR